MDEEKIIIEWLLTGEEKEFITNKSRGAENRLKYAAQLCHLKLKGRFIDDWSEISIKVLNHLAKQLEVELVHSKINNYQKSTEIRIRAEVKKLLHFKEFDFESDKLVIEFVEQNPILINKKEDITDAIEKYLINSRVILPSRSRLMKYVYAQYGKKQTDVFEKFAAKITVQQREYLNTTYKDNSVLNKVKKPIGEVNIKNVTAKIEIIENLLSLELEALPWQMIHPKYSEKLARLVYKNDISSIRRIQSRNKRDVMVVCYLYESTKTLIDLIVASYDKLTMEIERRVNRDYEIHIKRIRSEQRLNQEKALSTLKLLQNHEDKDNTTLAMFFKDMEEQSVSLEKIINGCEQVEEFEKYGKAELATRRYSYITKFMQRFFNLKLETAKGTEVLKRAIETYKGYHKEEAKINRRTASEFIDNTWRKALINKSGRLNRKVWEIGLFFAAKKELKSGNLYLPQSRFYRDFWAPLYSKKKWKEDRAEEYKELNAKEDPKEVMELISEEFNQHLDLAIKSFGSNNFADFKNGKLVIHKDDPLLNSESVKELKSIIDSHAEPIRIENVLVNLQRKTNYMRAFKPLEGFKSRELPELRILNAALTGHATNLGLYGMSQNCNGITGDKLSYVSNYYITPENLQEASNILTAAQQEYWLTKVIGSGERSSSDGQRFKTSHKGLYSSMHPRYFGALDRAITIYTHISDQCSVFNTEILSCAAKEAAYVLDGLLDNQAIVRPFEHSTDTAGFTEIMFALCYLLGISFQPHFKDIKDQQLYSFDRKKTKIPELFSTEKADEDLVCEQWDDMIRLVCSLKKRLIKPHIIIKKLRAQEGLTKIAKALVHLGRIIKTTYILRYLHDKQLRYAVRKQLNKGESRHTLARYVFFADQGAFKTNDYEEMMNKASSLSFISNAMVLHNTEQMQTIYEKLAAKGKKIDPEDMKRVLPLSTKNILIHGTYSF